jgi:aryl sulfotransferase
MFSAVMDSRQWNNFEFRPDDVVIAAFPKCGTTLTQQIVAQLIFDADPKVNGHGISPWIDIPTPPFVVRLVHENGGKTPLELAASQTHRRFMKTHLPIENLVYSPSAKYIWIGRDLRDQIWSFHNHLMSTKGSAPPTPPPNAPKPDPNRPPIVPAANPDVRQYYHDVLDGRWAYMPLWSYFRDWWAVRDLPNLMLLHHSDVIADLPGAIRRVAAFLDIPIAETKLPAMVRHCSLEHMREVARDDEFLNFVFREGSRNFMNKGTNGRWRDVLSEAEAAKCDEIAQRELPPDLARWLKYGGPIT